MRSLVISGPRGLQLRCIAPERPLERMRGLLRRSTIEIDEAMLIPDSTSVHTFGMRFPILLSRLDESLRVVDVRRVMPCRLVMRMGRARHVLECHPDVDLRTGDILRLDGERELRMA